MYGDQFGEFLSGLGPKALKKASLKEKPSDFLEQTLQELFLQTT